jgi:hypothetical protein
MDKVQKSRNQEENVFKNIPNHDCPTSYNLEGRNTAGYILKNNIPVKTSELQ